MPCLSGGGLTVCRGNYKRKTIGRINKWCFGCRKRLWHKKVFHTERLVWKDKKLISGGYGEPFLAYECPRCGKDKTDFPGW